MLVHPCSPALAEPSREEVRRARDLFAASAVDYRAGRFAEAARLLREAYRLNPVPNLQYNLARALEGQGDLPGAIAAYRSFVATAGEVPDRAALEQRILTLERQVAEKEALERQVAQRNDAAVGASAPAEVRQSRRPAEPSRARKAAPWAVFGVGLAGLVTGAGLGAASRSEREDAVGDPVGLSAAASVDRARGFALGANLAFALGGALALSGGVWGIVELVRSKRTRTELDGSGTSVP